MIPEELIKEWKRELDFSYDRNLHMYVEPDVEAFYNDRISCIRDLLARAERAEKALGEIQANLPTNMGKLDMANKVHNSHPEAVSIVSELLKLCDDLSLILNACRGGQNDNRR